MITPREVFEVLNTLHEEVYLIWESNPDIDFVGVDGYINCERFAELINQRLEQKP